MFFRLRDRIVRPYLLLSLPASSSLVFIDASFFRNVLSNLHYLRNCRVVRDCVVAMKGRVIRSKSGVGRLKEAIEAKVQAKVHDVV